LSVSVVIVGINGWDEYTKPCILSIAKHEPDVEVMLIDNASEPPYPISGVRTKRVSYAEAINKGVKQSQGDWIISINNDVLCQGKFVETIEKLDKGVVYGRQIITEKGHVWLGNWLAVFHRSLFEKVGGFDPLFEMCGFEDADFCVRAKKLGYMTLPVDLPFHHLWGRTRWQLPKYPQVRKHNMDYFEQKHGFRLGESVRVIHD